MTDASQFRISVAELTLEYISDSPEIELQVDRYHTPFLSSDNTKSDLIIRVFDLIPDLPPDCEQIFSADVSPSDLGQTNMLWNVFKSVDFYILTFFDVSKPKQTMAALYFHPKIKEWMFYSDIKSKKGKSYSINPLTYPAGALTIYYFCIFQGAFFLHASGIFHNKGMIFSGISGSGKSTISKLWYRAGAAVINDDKLILRKTGSTYFMFNSPMTWYVDIPKKSQLDNIFFIHHATENAITILQQSAAVAKLLSLCIQHNYDRSFIEQNLAIAVDICSHTKVFQLGFMPNESVVHFINNIFAKK